MCRVFSPPGCSLCRCSPGRRRRHQAAPPPLLCLRTTVGCGCARLTREGKERDNLYFLWKLWPIWWHLWTIRYIFLWYLEFIEIIYIFFEKIGIYLCYSQIISIYPINYAEEIWLLRGAKTTGYWLEIFFFYPLVWNSLPWRVELKTWVVPPKPSSVGSQTQDLSGVAEAI
jgi:hypothetical protein